MSRIIAPEIGIRAPTRMESQLEIFGNDHRFKDLSPEIMGGLTAPRVVCSHWLSDLSEETLSLLLQKFPYLLHTPLRLQHVNTVAQLGINRQAAVGNVLGHKLLLRQRRGRCFFTDE